jgi:uncharacterized protein (DUF58 family)
MRSIRWIFFLLFRLGTTLQQGVKRRLTRPGLTMLGGIVVSGFLGLDIFGSVAYQAFLMLCCLLGMALVCSGRLRATFALQRILPRFGTVGVPLSYQVHITNQSSHAQQDLVVLEELADTRPDFQGFLALLHASQRPLRSFSLRSSLRRWSFDKVRLWETPVPPLRPGESADVNLDLVPLKRGHVRFVGLTVGRPDPLGLARALARVTLPQSMLILPRRYGLPHIPLPGTVRHQPGGVAQASSVGESEEFVALRDYRHGDPLRRIHWRSWARVGRPIVKEYQDEFFVRHALILDTFATALRAEVFEEAVSVAASFACTLQTQESLLDLLFVGTEAYCFTSGRGLAHTDQMLEILASVQPCTDKSIDSLENLVLNHIGAVSGCVCVLVRWDAARQQLIQRLKTMNVPLLVLVIKERGGRPLEPGPLRDEPHEFHVLEVGSVAEGLARL